MVNPRRRRAGSVQNKKLRLQEAFREKAHA